MEIYTFAAIAYIVFMSTFVSRMNQESILVRILITSILFYIGSILVRYAWVIDPYGLLNLACFWVGNITGVASAILFLAVLWTNKNKI